ncbi:hypothetical protein OIE68_12200 [Nocardia vinacea]|uniref:Uncharacterized protein n=1 Tax=Nocardia vinacea TaxID=96468 RepID=A0ABZ1YWV0_9NOCA|nr:hypothetical protein OIE68_12200 [Nocardia vinacea]
MSSSRRGTWLRGLACVHGSVPPDGVEADFLVEDFTRVRAVAVGE